jgi:soluble lytic murein transglycosylase-like protein
MSTNKAIIISTLLLTSAFLALNATPSLSIEDMTTREVEALLRDRIHDVPEAQIHPLAKHIVHVAHKHHFAVSSILSVIMTESGFHAGVVSSIGATGLMQICPETAAFVADKNDIDEYNKASDLKNPFINVTIGVTYLSMLRDRFGNPHLYLAAYNMGPNKFQRLVQSPEKIERFQNSNGPVVRYVRKIRNGVYPIVRDGQRLALAAND